MPQRLYIYIYIYIFLGPEGPLVLNDSTRPPLLTTLNCDSSVWGRYRGGVPVAYVHLGN